MVTIASCQWRSWRAPWPELAPQTASTSCSTATGPWAPAGCTWRWPRSATKLTSRCSTAISTCGDRKGGPSRRTSPRRDSRHAHRSTRARRHRRRRLRARAPRVASGQSADVRTPQEWNEGHLPGATLILWQDLYADQRTLKFKSLEEIRALLARAGGAESTCHHLLCGRHAREPDVLAARAVGVPVRV